REELIKTGFVIREQNDSEKNEHQVDCLVSQPHEPVVVAKIALEPLKQLPISTTETNQGSAEQHECFVDIRPSFPTDLQPA
ncbi:MAG: hypothetical protein ACKOS8_10895, partial [Gemmataceae bacterium]